MDKHMWLVTTDRLSLRCSFVWMGSFLLPVGQIGVAGISLFCPLPTYHPPFPPTTCFSSLTQLYLLTSLLHCLPACLPPPHYLLHTYLLDRQGQHCWGHGTHAGAGGGGGTGVAAWRDGEGWLEHLLSSTTVSSSTKIMCLCHVCWVKLSLLTRCPKPLNSMARGDICLLLARAARHANIPPA